MTAFKTTVLELAVAAGGRQRCPLDIDGLTAESSGWIWCRPRPTWIEAMALPSAGDLPDLSIHLMAVHGRDDYMCIVPVSSTTAMAHLHRASGDGVVDLDMRSANGDTEGKAAVIVSRSKTAADAPFLLQVALGEARKWLARTTGGDGVAYKSPPPGPFDRLGFCTWSALGPGVRPSEEALQRLVADLVEAQIPVQTFVIDDGWQSLRPFTERLVLDGKAQSWRRRGLWDFETHPSLGTDGLRGATKLIKTGLARTETARHVEVGVWLTLNGGYWDGIHPQSPLIEQYGCKKYPASMEWWECPNMPENVPYMPEGHTGYWLPTPETAPRFWYDWFRRLQSEGVSFLKVDNQAAVTSLDGAEGAAHGLGLWKAMTAAAEEVFGPGRVINCMAHSEMTFAGVEGLGLATDGERFVARSSDDYGLTGRQAAQQQHIFTNIFNAVVFNATCIISDADMFMTADQHPFAHALLRALFPGPLLLADQPGKHDTDLIWRLIALDRSDTAAVLKTRTAAQPLPRRMRDISIRDAKDGTGLWACVQERFASLVAVWNVRGGNSLACRVRDEMSVADVQDALSRHPLDKTYAVVRVGTTQRRIEAASMVSQGNKPEQVLGPVELEPMGQALFWVAPMENMAVGAVAVLGLAEQYAGPVALQSVRISLRNVDVELKYAGVLGLIVAAPLKPSATALVDGRPEYVKVQQLPKLDGERQSVFFLSVKVVGGGTGDVWKVQVAIA